jgi:predicted flap endonuclease-1-like 5' DNA nuclease
MNGRSRSLVLAAAVLALVVATTGCGSKKQAAATTTAASTSAAQTTTATATATTSSSSSSSSSSASSSSSSSSGVASIATAGNCRQLAGLSAAFSKALSGVGTNDFDSRAKILKEFADKTPSDIRPDFETLAAAFSKYASALKEIHFTPGQVPNAATLAKLQQLSTSIDQTAVTKAATNISAWAKNNCKKP